MDNSQNQETNTRQTGIPDIPTSDPKRRWAVWIAASIMLLLLCYAWMHPNKEQTNNNKTIEEDYSLSHEENQSTENSETLPKKPTEEELKQQAATAATLQAELQKRLAAPLLVSNNLSNATSQENTVDQNQHQNNVTQILNPSSTISEGTVIAAVLETAIQSDLPGYIRAIVSEAVYSQDGTHPLIPAGSHLVGRYQSGLSQGQTRLFAIWSSIITAQGKVISLEAPSVDTLGRSGVEADNIETHFFERFGTATLLSILSISADNIGVDDNASVYSKEPYQQVVGQNLSQAANQTFKNNINLKPTINVNQGKAIKVFVNKSIVIP